MARLGALPPEALVLPERAVFGHDGSRRELTKEWVGTNVENNGKQLKKIEEKARKEGGEWVCVGCGLCPMPISLVAYQHPTRQLHQHLPQQV